MRYVALALFLVFAGLVSPGFALEQRGALILNKVPLLEFESPRKLGCTEMYDVRKDENVPDMRQFRNYNCQARYAVILRGEPGYTVTVFGDFNFGKTSGFLIVIKNDDKPVWIEDIEYLPAGKWVDVPGKDQYGSFRAFYQAAPRFSQSVASIQWGKWWEGEDPRP